MLGSLVTVYLTLGVGMLFGAGLLGGFLAITERTSLTGHFEDILHRELASLQPVTTPPDELRQRVERLEVRLQEHAVSSSAPTTDPVLPRSGLDSITPTIVPNPEILAIETNRRQPSFMPEDRATLARPVEQRSSETEQHPGASSSVSTMAPTPEVWRGSTKTQFATSAKTDRAVRVTEVWRGTERYSVQFAVATMPTAPPLVPDELSERKSAPELPPARATELETPNPSNSPQPTPMDVPPMSRLREGSEDSTPRSAQETTPAIEVDSPLPAAEESPSGNWSTRDEKGPQIPTQAIPLIAPSLPPLLFGLPLW